MTNGENKICPSCKQPFVCKMDDILNCHCYEAKISEQMRSRLKADFDDCLCATCLQQFSVSDNAGGEIVADRNA